MHTMNRQTRLLVLGGLWVLLCLALPAWALGEKVELLWHKSAIDTHVVSAAHAPLFAVPAWSDVGIYATDGTLKRVIATGEPGGYALALSPDGRLLATGCKNNSFKVWRVEDGACLQTILGHKYAVNTLAFSPDGQYIASGSLDKTIKLWRVSDAECEQIITDEEQVLYVAFSPDGQTVASGSWVTLPDTPLPKGNPKDAPKRYPCAVKLWRVRDGACLRKIDTCRETMAFSPSGQSLAVAGMDNTIRILRIPDGVCVQTVHGYSLPVLSMSFSPDGQTLASRCMDRSLKLWRVTDGVCLRTFNRRIDMDADLDSLAFSSDGETLAAGTHTREGYSTIELWRVRDGVCMKKLTGDYTGISKMALTPDGTLLVTYGHDDRNTVWRVSDGTCLHTFFGDLHGLAISPDGQTLAYGSYEGRITLQRVDDRNSLPLTGHTQAISALAFSPDGHTLASCSGDHTIKLWRVSDGQCLRTLTGHTHSVCSLAFAPNGRLLATCSGDSTVKLWRVSDGHCIETIPGNRIAVTHVAFSPDGLTLAAASEDGTIRVWGMVHLSLGEDGQNDAPQCTFNADRHGYMSIAFLADAQVLAVVGSDNKPQLWRTSDGTCLRTLAIDPYEGAYSAFSRNGQILAAGGYSAGISVWRLSSPR